MATTQQPLNENITSSETKEQVGNHLEDLIDSSTTTETPVYAHESILAPANAVSPTNETDPDPNVSTNTPDAKSGKIHKPKWYRYLAEKLDAVVTKDAAYYQYGNDVYHPDTGKTEFEFMPLYARIGMHALFCGSLEESILEDGYLMNLFHKQSVKAGKHFDDPASVASIPGFAKTYSLKTDELLIPDLQHGYKTFNDFFSRKLKDGARPPAAPEDSRVMVSPADCRCVVYESVQEGQKFWIKGDRFTVPELLQNSVPNPTDYTNASIGIFRLAPQDYHRWHCPVTGTIVAPPYDIDGGLFTVNPMAVRSRLDVLTSNKRSVLPILTPYSRTPVLVIAVGALLVGSINNTVPVQPGTTVIKGQELGYFSYGGSTVVVLWPADAEFQVQKTIKMKSEEAVECLIKVGQEVGVLRGVEGL